MIKKLFTLLLACGFFMINSGVLAAEQLPKIGLSAKNLTSIQTQESEKSKKKLKRNEKRKRRVPSLRIHRLPPKPGSLRASTE